METPLQLEFRTVANGAGAGTIEKGPEIPGQRWDLATASVKSESTVDVPRCELYMNNTQVDGTENGNLDASDMVSGIPLHCGQKVKAVWTGADPGVELRLAITGTLTTAYR